VRPAVKPVPEPVSDERNARRMARRDLLKLSPLLLAGAFAIPSWRSKLLGAGLEFNNWISAAIFREQHLVRTYSDADLTPLDRFYVNTYDLDDPGVDIAHWTLTLDGDVKHPGEYTLAQIQSLPRQRQNTKHVCVEGWDAIGRFGGARLSDFLQMAGANPRARFLYMECADDYYESLDMATALHPQSLLCYEMYDQPLPRMHGAPVRLSLPTKLGYKSAKYLQLLRVTDVMPKKGYWEDQGYGWYAGI
jgi:DMSO/TMAO reductase YedYZ molybdopterin-dependent catalytic subunit